MKTARELVEEIKRNYEKDIRANSFKYKSSIVKQLDKYFRMASVTGSEDVLSTFSKMFFDNFSLSIEEKKLIAGDLVIVQSEIADVWEDYFGKITAKNTAVISSEDYDRMLAVHKVDFPGLEDKIRKLVKKETRKAIGGRYGYQELRQKLKAGGLTFDKAVTLSNTAVAQFDNSYHVNAASAAGVEYFLYDGGIVKHTREFCKAHLKRVYTIAELKKLDNHQDLPVETSLGGYNCIHYLTALVGYKRKVYGEVYTKSHHLGLAA